MGRLELVRGWGARRGEEGVGSDGGVHFLNSGLLTPLREVGWRSPDDDEMHPLCFHSWRVVAFITLKRSMKHVNACGLFQTSAFS